MTTNDSRTRTTMTSTASVRLLTFLLALFLACGAAARDGALMRGVAPDKRFDTDGIEVVDKFTGNLSARIPIGPAFQSNGSLSYAFVLQYNSRAWDYMSHQRTANNAMSDVYELVNVVEFAEHRWSDENQELRGVEAVPAAGTNAGLGWTLTVGGQPKFLGFDPVGTKKLHPRLSYVTPDGAEHFFYLEQFGPAPASSTDLVTTAQPTWQQTGSKGTKYYARDGSRLRMRKVGDVDPATGLDVVREIDFPDGTVHRVECLANCSGAFAEWYLTAIRDRFGSTLTISHTARPFPTGGAGSTVPWIWTIEERNANAGAVTRTHQIELEVRRNRGMRSDWPAQWWWDAETRVREVRLDVSESGNAVYRFEYSNPLLYGDQKSNWGDASFRLVPFVVENGEGLFDFSLLDRVVMPDLATGKAAGDWRFRYWGEHADYPLTTDLVEGPKFANANFIYKLHRKSGLLAELIHPTGRGTSIDYRNRAYPRAACGAKLRDFIEFFTGVESRQLTRPVIASNVEIGRMPVPGSKWLYRSLTYFLNTSGLPPEDDVNVSDQPSECGNRSVEVTNTVVDPAGKTEVTFFSVYADSQASGLWSYTEYGLPISHFAGVDGMPVSGEMYDCRAANLQSQTDSTTLGHMIRRIVARNRYSGETGTCGEPLRTTYLAFEHGAGCDPTIGVCIAENRRVKSSRTVLADVCNTTGCVRGSQTRQVQVLNSGWDGLGHYRTVTSSGDFGALAETGRTDSRVSVTNYNPTVTYDHATRTITFPPGTGDIENFWILDTYDQTTVTEGGKSNIAKYEFDTSNGRLKSWRKLKELTGSETASDIKATYTRAVETDGTVATTATYSGGDHNAVTTPEYAIQQRTWLGGTRTIKYMDCGGTGPLQTVYDATLDVKSGLPKSATDGMGLSMTYQYDKLLRLTSADHELDQPITHSYPSMLDRSVLDVVTRQASATASIGTALRKSSAFDDFEEWDPDGTGPLPPEWVRRGEERADFKNAEGVATVRIDAMGRVRARTAMADTVAKGALSVYDYDVFGRVVRIDPPTTGQTTIEYAGGWKRRTLVEGVARKDAPSIETHHLADSFGRLAAVHDWSDSSSGGLTPTYYDYDPGNRLTAVRQGSQKRVLEYDGRGFLWREQYPELDQKEVHYTYDSRGNVRHRILRAKGSNTTGDATDSFVQRTGGEFDRRFRYDGSERLRSVEIRGGSTPRVLKSFTYDGDRVTNATRINYIDVPAGKNLPPQIAVETAYAHDAAGRVSTKTLKAGFDAAVSYTYDDLGGLKKLVYPVLTNCGTSTCGVGSGREVVFTNSDGQQNQVQHRKSSTAALQNLIARIQYHPNGMWETIERKATGAGANSVDRQEVVRDGKYLGRPSHVWTTGAAVTDRRRDPGEIFYDTAGNVRCIGTSEDSCTDRFFFDGVNRLAQANVTTSSGGLMKWFYTYDRYGNITTVDRTDDAIGAISFNASAATNRLPGADAYDIAGNLRKWADPRRPNQRLEASYDAMGMASRIAYLKANGTPQTGRVFIYDADDERVGVIDYAGADDGARNPSGTTLTERWTVRGTAGEALAEFSAEPVLTSTGDPARTWHWSRDYVHVLGRPAVEIRRNGTGEEVLDLHWDHLGSINCVTLGTGACFPSRKYHPFGQELAESDTDRGRLRFLGQERDDNNNSDPYGDLDYLHARYYSPTAGRFLSPDPIRGSASRPQSWNRYAYALNNPVTLVDPSGLSSEDASDCTPAGQGCVITVVATLIDGDQLKERSTIDELGGLIGVNGDVRGWWGERGADVADFAINWADGWYIGASGFGGHFLGGSPKELVQAMAINWFGYEDLARMEELTSDDGSVAYKTGKVAGEIGSIVLPGGASGSAVKTWQALRLGQWRAAWRAARGITAPRPVPVPPAAPPVVRPIPPRPPSETVRRYDELTRRTEELIKRADQLLNK